MFALSKVMGKLNISKERLMEKTIFGKENNLVIFFIYEW
jgi:hypothetical protein